MIHFSAMPATSMSFRTVARGTRMNSGTVVRPESRVYAAPCRRPIIRRRASMLRQPGVVGDEQRRRAAAITELLGWIQLIISRCSSHPSGIARVSSANCIAFGCPLSIVAC